jgi:DNA polymerase-3 subunit epsilon
VKFVAIDVETANPRLASVCQIGAATFEDRRLTEIWNTLINPDDYFDAMNVAVHGIEEADVRDAPMFPQIFDRLRQLLTGQVVIHHTGFDKVALTRVAEKHGLPEIECDWLDTAKVARRAWPQFANKGYGLANIAKTLGIDFRHHAAQEDARAAGEVLLGAIRQTGLSVVDWLARVKKPVDLSTAQSTTREGNPDGPLAGETVVFTGALSIPRREAANLAAEAGCDVAVSVTMHTTLLVVGDQDIRRLAGHEKSSKHRKVEELMTKGLAIRIVGQSDFQRLIRIERTL